MPSRFANPSELLYELAHELDVRRRDDPLTVLRDLNSAVSEPSNTHLKRLASIHQLMRL